MISLRANAPFQTIIFFTLGLKDAGIIFEDIDDFYRFIHPEDIEFYKQAFAEMLSSDSKTSQIRVRCISEQRESNLAGRSFSILQRELRKSSG